MSEVPSFVEALIQHFIDCSECREKLKQLDFGRVEVER